MTANFGRVLIQTISAVSALTVASMALPIRPAAVQPKSASLASQQDAWPEIVSGYVRYREDKVSIAGRIFDSFFERNEPFAVFDLRGRYSRFEGHLGVSDAEGTEEGTFRIQIDGETVVEGKVRGGEKPTPLELDLSGAQSMRIEISWACLIASPKFTRGGSADSTKVSLVSPSNGAKAKRGSIMLTWKPIDNAVAYGIHVTATKLDDAQLVGSHRMWAFTSTEQPVFSLDARELPTGEYRWTVIAFDDKRTLGVVSDFRRLIITK